MASAVDPSSKQFELQTFKEEEYWRPPGYWNINPRELSWVSQDGMIKRVSITGNEAVGRVFWVFFRDTVSGEAWLQKHQVCSMTYSSEKLNCQKLLVALNSILPAHYHGLEDMIGLLKRTIAKHEAKKI